jgi:hypothetical protein
MENQRQGWIQRSAGGGRGGGAGLGRNGGHIGLSCGSVQVSLDALLKMEQDQWWRVD